MVEHYPDSQVRLEDNVLFICKLNARTEEEDLKDIFMQFGKVTDCQIVKDWKTLKSLQYGFIEYEKAADAEQAYFKMQNALIDNH